MWKLIVVWKISRVDSQVVSCGEAAFLEAEVDLCVEDELYVEVEFFKGKNSDLNESWNFARKLSCMQKMSFISKLQIDWSCFKLPLEIIVFLNKTLCQ